MKRLLFLLIIAVFSFETANMQAQEIDRQLLQTLLEDAKVALEGANYKTALEKISRVEEMIGSKTRGATAYIRIKSHYGLNEFEKCVEAADAYFAASPKQDETLAELKDCRDKAAEKVRQAEEAARQKAAHEKAAADEWDRIRNTDDIDAVTAFLFKYGDTPQASAANRKSDDLRAKIAARQKAEHEKEADDEWKRLQSSTDLSQLENYLKKYGDTPNVSAARAKYEDEKAWQNARAQNDLLYYERYLDGNTSKAYRQAALNVLDENYFRLGKDAADRDNLSTMNDLFNRYQKRLSNGKYTGSIADVRCNTYTRLGDKMAADKKSTSAQNDAIRYYETAKAYCNSRIITGRIKKSERRIKAINRPDHVYFGWTGDEQTPIGFTLGSLKQKKVGCYLSLRLNSAFLMSAKEFKENYSSSYTTFIEDEEKSANMNVTFGLNKRLFYPVWLYLGGGITSDKMLIQYNEYNEDKGWLYPTGEEPWGYDPKEVKYRAVAEGGLILKLSVLYLSFGVRSNLEESYPAFGAGFAF